VTTALDLHALAPAPGRAIDLAAVAGALAHVVAADQLAATPQDPSFHAEGDVWLHTRMALAALVDDPAYAALDATARAIVFAALMLHDVGKPGTTRVEADGRITSRGHSALGDGLTRVALWRAGVPFALREHVCALVRSHQVPFFAIERSPADAARLIARLSLATRNRWLALVAAADGRGRRTADPDDQRRIVDNCALYAELAAEQGALDHPRAFADDHTRVVWLADLRGTRSALVPAHDDTAGEAVILSGLPAAGKSTWLASHPELAVVSLDDLRDELGVDPAGGQGAVIAAARERARSYLRAGRSFAWSATNLSRLLRAGLVDLCRGYRFRTHVVYCEVDPDEQRRRNRERAAAAVVPAAAVERMLRRWQVPTPDEAHRVTYLVDGERGDEPLGWPPTPG
jgi:predicted kinase